MYLKRTVIFVAVIAIGLSAYALSFGASVEITM